MRRITAVKSPPSSYRDPVPETLARPKVEPVLDFLNLLLEVDPKAWKDFRRC